MSLFIIAQAAAYGQNVLDQYQVSLPDSITKINLMAGDLDKDGTFDLLGIGQVGFKQYVYVFEGNASAAPIVSYSFPLPFTPSFFKLVDINYDYDLDLIVSGRAVDGAASTRSYFGLSGLTLAEEKEVYDRTITGFELADLNGDLISERVTAGNGIIIEEYDGSRWVVVNDSVKSRISSIALGDINRDGVLDIVSSESDGMVWYQVRHGFMLSKNIIQNAPFNGQINVADIDTDGDFDFTIYHSKINNTKLGLLIFEDGVLNPSDSLTFSGDAFSFLADFNSDGQCDHYVRGSRPTAECLNHIYHDGEGISEAITPCQTQESIVFDYNGDGILDLISVIDSGLGLNIRLDLRASPDNKPPTAPVAIAVRIFSKTLLHWGQAFDDHTPSGSITYDVQPDSPVFSVAANFDFSTGKRLLSGHGNMLNNKFLLIDRDLPSIRYQVRAIDNALHASAPGLCDGNATCIEEKMVTMKVCRGELIQLAGEPEMIWFSFSRGMLASGPSYNHVASEEDTLFSFRPSLTGCQKLTVYILKFGKGLIEDNLKTKFVCAGEQIILSSDISWPRVSWYSKMNGWLSNENEIQIKVVEKDTIIALLQDPGGCSRRVRYSIQLSRPNVQVADDEHVILKGESVQLFATGAISYEWTPATVLDFPNSSQPIAKPEVTTRFTVTGKDSLGCIGEATVQVVIQNTAFIATLFTPDGNGANDFVRIHGLTEASDFNFSIHNREGFTVFETTNVQLAVSGGWDGSYRGTAQPNGVYFWKVRGTLPSGHRLTLNGGTTGAIVLVR